MIRSRLRDKTKKRNQRSKSLKQRRKKSSQRKKQLQFFRLQCGAFWKSKNSTQQKFLRPDRIIVGEVRGAETLDMLQAMNTGHEGSLTTIHANSPRDALSRLETLVLTAGVDLPLRAIREQISSAFDLLVQITRLVDGSRRISHITEVLRMESEVITLQDIFLAKPPDEDTAFGGATRLLSQLGCTGLKPQFLEKMAAHGVALQPNFFEEDQSGFRSNLAVASFGGFS